MPIRYIHNDPGSLPRLETVTVPRPARTGHLAKLTLADICAEQVYAADTPEFVDWQCRDAALRTLDTWEQVSTPLRFWQNNQRSIALIPRRSTGLAASYERTSIGFDQWPARTPDFFVGASADAVSHELGHAILDARRPGFWDSMFAEVAAFHEGFADCISLLVALLDDQVVATLFAAAPQHSEILRVDNAAAQVAESVAMEVKAVFGTQHPASVPRRLSNSLQWAIPTTLPPNPTATNLSREPHSFGRVFTGCFYDCIDNIYRTVGPHTPQGLRDAVLTAGRLLATAVETAPEDIRFFRSVGRDMIHADSQLNAGNNHLSVRDAFAAHNVALGSSASLAPVMSLRGPSPDLRGPAARRLNTKTRSDLTKRMGAKQKARVSTSGLKIGGKSVVRARLRQRMKLLLGKSRTSTGTVIVPINQEVLLGSDRSQCVVLGELPNRAATEDEVMSFMESLSDSGALDASAANRRRTHAVRKRGREQFLRRVRFSCSNWR